MRGNRDVCLQGVKGIFFDILIFWEKRFLAGYMGGYFFWGIFGFNGIGEMPGLGMTRLRGFFALWNVVLGGCF